MKKSLIIIFSSALILSILVSFILADNSSASVNSSSNITNVTFSANVTNPLVNTTNSTSQNTTNPLINQTLHPLPSPANGQIQEDERTNQIKTSQYFSQEAICRINFNIGVINAFASAFPNASQLQTPLTNLQNDLSHVQSLGNSSEIQSFINGQYSEDVKKAETIIPTHEVPGISLSKRTVLVSSYNQLKSIYDLCEKTNYINITQERLNAYQIQLTNFQNETNNLASRGFDVTSLNQLLQDAQNQIITPLQNALSSATTAQQIQTAIRSYCLFDGCVMEQISILMLNLRLQDWA